MNKIWFVTGAGSGIGTGITKAALKVGDRVVATGRNLDKVRDALSDFSSDNLALVQLDVTDETAAMVAVEEAGKKFGRIDVAVNNAGYSLLGNFEEMTTAEIERQLATNFYGVVHVMRAVLPVMRKQRSGHVINISSMAGVIGYAHCAAYAASKFAVEGLSSQSPPKSSGSASRSPLSSRVSSAQTFWPSRTSSTPATPSRTTPQRATSKRRGLRTMARSKATPRSWARHWSRSPT